MGQAQKRVEIINQRKSEKLTQQEVANKAGISRSFYAMLEAGQRGCSIHTWAKLGCALNLTEGQLLAIILKDEKQNE
jgi:transcriptional regulator with XRE-family HTH domain